MRALTRYVITMAPIFVLDSLVVGYCGIHGRVTWVFPGMLALSFIAGMVCERAWWKDALHNCKLTPKG